MGQATKGIHFIRQTYFTENRNLKNSFHLKFNKRYEVSKKVWVYLKTLLYLLAE